MKKIKIFTGDGRHIKFLKDFISRKYEVELDDSDFIPLTSVTDIAISKNQFQENTDEEGINVVLMDAELKASQLQASLNTLKTRSKIEFDCFLFPNNIDTGSLDGLLYELIPVKNNQFRPCFDKHEKELSKINGYRPPSPDGKIYAYLDAVLSDTDRGMMKYEVTDYNHASYWDIYNAAAKPLTDFLDTYFKKVE